MMHISSGSKGSTPNQTFQEQFVTYVHRNALSHIKGKETQKASCDLFKDDYISNDTGVFCRFRKVISKRLFPTIDPTWHGTGTPFTISEEM